MNMYINSKIKNNVGIEFALPMLKKYTHAVMKIKE